MSDERYRKGPFGDWQYADLALDALTAFNVLVLAAVFGGPIGLLIFGATIGTIVAAVFIFAVVRRINHRADPRSTRRPPGPGPALPQIRVAALKHIAR